MFLSKAKGPRAAAQGIEAESPQESRRATRTCSGKPGPPKGGCALVVIGIGIRRRLMKMGYWEMGL